MLTVGRPLSWEDSLDLLAYVREHGVVQFIKQYEKHKDVQKVLDESSVSTDVGFSDAGPAVLRRRD